MQIVIDIPKEFEDHFNKDRFEDSLHRLSADAHLTAGNYEQETAIMLLKAFKDAKVLPEKHGRLIDADALKRNAVYIDDEDEAAVFVGCIDAAKTMLKKRGRRQ